VLLGAWALVSVMVNILTGVILLTP
jgi:hypothetical protein